MSARNAAQQVVQAGRQANALPEGGIAKLCRAAIEDLCRCTYVHQLAQLVVLRCAQTYVHRLLRSPAQRAGKLPQPAQVKDCYRVATRSSLSTNIDRSRIAIRNTDTRAETC